MSILLQMSVEATTIIHNESFKDSSVHLRVFLRLSKLDSQNLLVN